MSNRHIRHDLDRWGGTDFFQFCTFLWHVTRPTGSREERVCATAINLPLADLSAIEDPELARFPADALRWRITELEEETTQSLHFLSQVLVCFSSYQYVGVYMLFNYCS